MSPVSLLRTKLNVLRLLAVDDMPPRAVAAELDMSYDEVLDIASRHGYPEPDKMLWAIDHIQDSLDGTPSSDAPTPAAPKPAAVPAPAPVPVAVEAAPGSIEELLTAAAASTKKRTQAAGQKIADLVHQLRTTVNAETAEREAQAAQEAAAKEALQQIAALEAQLAEAKEKLKGAGITSVKPKTTTTVTAGSSDSKVIRAWAAANGVHCAPIGRVPARVREAYEAAHRGEAA